MRLVNVVLNNVYLPVDEKGKYYTVLFSFTCSTSKGYTNQIDTLNFFSPPPWCSGQFVGTPGSPRGFLTEVRKEAINAAKEEL